MKKFQTFVIQYNQEYDVYLIIPSLFAYDIQEVIDEFNSVNNTIQTGVVVIDNTSIVGHRKEGNVVCYDVVKGRIIRNSGKVNKQYTKQLNKLKKEYTDILDEKVQRFLTIY